ncbi:hypothetical protein BS50DRAFT_588267 [Corynespora cassiicola Philippines]|uniref:Uncharacterized protein n=1 Tax=Corynespora cassiicola Philippines TaxID=1448308 RepID=A0A2T2NPB9_CORCC|nr:hypothetical protein BS50DRAFT_588267 [Corynespora cassiicola Philippines]
MDTEKPSPFDDFLNSLTSIMPPDPPKECPHPKSAVIPLDNDDRTKSICAVCWLPNLIDRYTNLVDYIAYRGGIFRFKRRSEERYSYAVNEYRAMHILLSEVEAHLKKCATNPEVTSNTQFKSLIESALELHAVWQATLRNIPGVFEKWGPAEKVSVRPLSDCPDTVHRYNERKELEQGTALREGKNHVRISNTVEVWSVWGSTSRSHCPLISAEAARPRHRFQRTHRGYATGKWASIDGYEKEDTGCYSKENEKVEC